MLSRESALFELTRNLIDIQSITGNEGGCCNFLADYLAARKWRVERIPVSPDRFDVFATHGEPEVVLSTHLDTVPPFIPSSEDTENVYGRGSCDAKGIAAAEIFAAESLARNDAEKVGLLFLVGEETLSDGAHAANRHPTRSKYLINGEPTCNKLVLGTKGNLRVHIRTRGTMAHSAYPELGDSAIDKLLSILADVRKLPLAADKLLGATTLNIGMISGGCAVNVVPGEAEAQLLFRTISQEPGDPCLLSELERIAHGRAELTVIRKTPAVKMEAIEGFDTDVVAFSTDLPALTAWGRPVLLGPGSIHDAHTDHEHIRKQDLINAVEHYRRLTQMLLARAAAA